MKTLLMIDDEEVNFHQVASFLDHDEYVLLHERNPTEGIKKARAQRPDLIILDIRMEPIDGFDVIDRLRKHGMTAGIPIVIYSSIGEDDEIRLRSLGLNIDHVIQNSRKAAPRLLEACIKRILSGDDESLALHFKLGEKHLSVQKLGERVYWGEKEIPLTPAQRLVVWTLAQKRGGYVHSNQLSAEYRKGMQYNDWDVNTPNNNSFFKFMNDLRKRIPEFIKNDKGVGYYLDGFLHG